MSGTFIFIAAESRDLRDADPLKVLKVETRLSLFTLKSSLFYTKNMVLTKQNKIKPSPNG
jgi:hypothetical protein